MVLEVPGGGECQDGGDSGHHCSGYGAFDIAKAQIRLFFGDLELSVGKTRSNWGAGNFFNAGDLIFEEVPSDLTVDEFLTTNRWMVLPRFYLGDFTYLELITMAPPYNLGEQLAAQLATPPQPIPPGPGFDQASAGGRFFHDFGPLQGQIGYSILRRDGISKQPI
jgi:hypothetical protein